MPQTASEHATDVAEARDVDKEMVGVGILTRAVLIIGLIGCTFSPSQTTMAGAPVEGIERELNRLERRKTKPAPTDTNRLRRQLDQAEPTNAERNTILRSLRRLNRPPSPVPQTPTSQPPSRTKLF